MARIIFLTPPAHEYQEAASRLQAYVSRQESG
jgi:hypothetical protein